jgi:hypothetical protein
MYYSSYVNFFNPGKLKGNPGNVTDLLDLGRGRESFLLLSRLPEWGEGVGWGGARLHHTSLHQDIILCN